MQVTDQKLEIAIGRMLQVGVLLAAAVVLIGVIRSKRAYFPGRGHKMPLCHNYLLAD